MPRILFAMHQETGHHNCTYKIARELQRRGYAVSYYAIPDLANEIRVQGFDVAPWFPDVFPTGFRERDAALGALEYRRLATERFNEMAQRMQRGCLNEELTRSSVVLIDVVEPLVSLLCRGLGLPQILLSTALPQTQDGNVPPPRSHALSGARMRWRAMRFTRQVMGRLASLAGACPPYLLAERMAVRFGVHRSELDSGTAFMPQLRGVPELVLCPEALDLPRPRRELRHYVESIDTGRSESDFDWGQIDATRPLIYGSMGTARYRPGLVQELFRALMEAMRSRPHWQLLLATGGHEPPARRPDNVIVATRVPQLAILKRSSAMITHAGLGSIKEAIACGVPMVAVPLSIDQPGNAARVQYHGLGVTLDLPCSSESLGSALEQVIRSPEIKAALARMRAAFEQTECQTPGADLIQAAALHAIAHMTAVTVD